MSGITSYTGTDGATGQLILALSPQSTARPIVLSGVMPESLIFCAGATVTLNCTSSASGVISFDRLFSPTDTAVAIADGSSTNAERGYSITVNGDADKRLKYYPAGHPSSRHEGQ